MSKSDYDSDSDSGPYFKCESQFSQKEYYEIVANATKKYLESEDEPEAIKLERKAKLAAAWAASAERIKREGEERYQAAVENAKQHSKQMERIMAASEVVDIAEWEKREQETEQRYQTALKIEREYYSNEET